MDEFDIVIDLSHDMKVPAHRRALLDDAEDGVYGYGHIGVPCTTFTTLLALQRRVLRLRTHPWGRPCLTGRDKEQVDNHNVLIRFSVAVAIAIIDSGGQVTLENVADRGDPDLPELYWPERASMCPLTLVPDVVALSMYASMVAIHLTLCSFHDHMPPVPPVKWITILATPGAAALLRPLSMRKCPKPSVVHQQAVGKDEYGASRAALSAAYPSGLNEWLAMVAVRFAGDARGAVEPAPIGAQIGCGPQLSPAMREAVEFYRRQLPSFADFRKMNAVPMRQRRLHAYPVPDVTLPEFEPAVPDADWDFLPGDEDGPDDERPSTFPMGLLRPFRAHHGIPGLPPGRVTYEMIWLPDEHGVRVGYDLVTTWTRAAFAAAPLLMEGLPHQGPGTVSLSMDMKQPWARFVLLDTRDPTDVVRMRRSTRDTVFAGPLQIDRAALRAMADEVEWYDIDPDILATAFEGGIEARSSCARHSSFTWHHSGVRENFEAAHTISVKEYADQWIIGPFPMPPTEPCRCIPNNIVMQHRAKVDENGNFHPYLKPRVTTNESFGDADSPNAGVSAANRTTSNPSHQTHAVSSAITHSCYREAGVDGSQYVTDLTSAFSFGLQQRTDWWLQVRFWILRTQAAIKCGYFINPRLLFGGTWGPNRFNRMRRPKTAWTRKRQAAFDRAHPPPPEVLAVVRERLALQHSGVLPQGTEQSVIGSLQGFIDDESGSSGTDAVPTPPELAHIDFAAVLARTAASGAVPAPLGSRVLVHCGFSILSSETAGWAVAMDKTQCGDGITVLGLRSSIEHDRSDCPPAKSLTMVAELRHIDSSIRSGVAIERSSIARSVGRLSNISQIAPDLLLHLHAGYALACAHARVSRDGHRARLRAVHVKVTGKVGSGFLALVNCAVELLEGGCSVPLMCEPSFPSPDDGGVLTVCSDASGEDGVGGFAFHADHPSAVWVVHGPWTAEIRDALAHSARTPKQRAEAGPQPRCSMPAAELFGPLAVASAVAADGITFSSVISVMDCMPATTAMTKSKSRSRVMRGIVHASVRMTKSWLGVHVRREHNTDCDLLSHPHSAALVSASARSAGLTVHERSISAACFAELEGLIREAFHSASECQLPSSPRAFSSHSFIHSAQQQP